MTTRRLAVAFCALALPLTMSACSNEGDTLAEPELDNEFSSSPEFEEATTERSSTTITTIHETITESAGKSLKTGAPSAAAAKKGSDKGPCEWKSVEEGQIGDKVSDYCDGRFASVGIYASDASVYLFWNGEDWEPIESAGETYTGFVCYDNANLETLGVPSELKEQMIICD